MINLACMAIAFGAYSYGDAISVRPMATLSTILVAVMLASHAVIQPRGVWSVQFVCIVVASIFHFSALPEIVLTGASSSQIIGRWVGQEVVSSSIALAVLLQSALSLGLAIASSDVRPAEVNDGLGPNQSATTSAGRAIVSVGFVFGVGGLLIWSAFALQAGLSLTSDYLDYLAAARGTNVPVQLSYYLIGIGLVLSAVDSRLFVSRLLVALFVLFSLYAFPLGLRGEILFPLMAYMAVRVYRRDSPRPVATVAIGVLVLLATAVVAITRTGQGSVTVDLILNSPRLALAELGGSLYVFVVTAGWHIVAGESYAGGVTYLGPFLVAWNRYVLRTVAPEEGLESWILSNRIAAEEGQIGGSIYAESFHNFGVWGSLLFLASIGIVLGLLASRGKTGEWTLAWIGIAVLAFQFHVRNSAATIPTVLVFSAVALAAAWFLAILLRTHKRPTRLPRDVGLTPETPRRKVLR